MFNDYTITTCAKPTTEIQWPSLIDRSLNHHSNPSDELPHIFQRLSTGDEGKNLGSRIHRTGHKKGPTGQSQLYLAPRELDVLQWAAQGKTTWETAQLLNLSEATVSFYARRACSRLGVRSKIHAVAICISEGLFKI